MLIAPHRGSRYLRILRGRRPTVSTTNDCGHGGKEDGPRASPVWLQGCEGSKLPLSLNPREGTMKKRMKMESRGGGSTSPFSTTHGSSLMW
jgi:hypothetical protein